MNTSSVLSTLIMIGAFIVAIGILVSVHEYGHFWVARRVGIRVLRFAIGFGKPLWKRVSPKDGVEYVIGSMPLGGYVKMLDEREGSVAPEDLPFSYNRAPVWKRIATLLAGPFANLIFAVLVYCLLFMIGIPSLKPIVGEVTAGSIAARAGLRSNDLITAVQDHSVTTREGVTLNLFEQVIEGNVHLKVRGAQGQQAERDVVLPLGTERRELTEPDSMMSGLGFEFWSPRLPAIIEAVTPDGAAAQAGLRAGDEILAIDNEPVGDLSAVTKLIAPRMNREIPLRIKRAGVEQQLQVKVAEETTDGHSVGRIGIQLRGKFEMPESMRALQKYTLLPAMSHAVAQTWDTSTLSLKVMWNMVRGKVSTKNLSGPISIAEYTGIAARQGVLSFINWLALISISIGIF